MTTEASPAPDPLLDKINALIQVSLAGERAAAREGFVELWPELTDPYHRCVLAHFAADSEEDPRAELTWDQRALAAADEVPTDRVELPSPAIPLRSLYPWLVLNVAQDHQKLGEPEQAREHLAAARAALAALEGTEYFTTEYTERLGGAFDKLVADLEEPTPAR